MSDNAQKTPIGKSLNEFALAKVRGQLQLLGKALPCSVVAKTGSIITVKFEIQSGFTLPTVTIPMFGPEYVRYPIQNGDLGIVIAADARLGGVSGLGGGVADLSQAANLTNLVFLPISNTEWANVDVNAVTIYGPNGVVLRDTESGTIFTLTPSGIAIHAADFITVTCGGVTFSIVGSSGAYSITGTTGTIDATTLTFTDGVASTTPTIMHNVWSLLVTWLNTHTHGGGPVPTVPFTGGSIAP